MKYDLLTYYPLIEKVHINCLYYTFWLKKQDFLPYKIDLSNCMVNYTIPNISHKKL
jgi:hypothetical protein